MPFVTVSFGDLEANYRKRDPSLLPYATVRSCTDNYKVRPMRSWLRWWTGQQSKRTRTRIGVGGFKYRLAAPNQPPDERRAAFWVGISTDEAHRANPPNVKWLDSYFPLIELGISRADCKRIIEESELPVPPKSGCFFCPLQPLPSWRRLARDHPDLMARAITWEDEATEQFIQRHPLRAIAREAKEQTALFDFDDAFLPCTSGNCFV